MKTPLRPLLLLFPVIAWAAYLVYLQIGQWNVDRYFFDANSVNWEGGGRTMAVGVSREISGELHKYRIHVENLEGRVLLSRDVIIDWDMGGAGFVAAMQVDSDPDLEIVVAERSGDPRSNFVLDHKDASVRELSFSAIGTGAEQLIRDWFVYHAPNPYGFGLFLVLTFLYYALFFPPAWLLKSLWRRTS